MTVEILKNDIRLPEQNNLTWIFPVRLNGGKPIPWRVDSFDLNVWFKQELGRYPHRERGDKDEREDILQNWSQLEPRLRAEAEKEAQLGFRLGVDGMRTSPGEWSRAQSTPKEELPPLNDAQRSAAKSLGISEEAYARMILAEERTANELLTRTKMFAHFLAEKLHRMSSSATVENVVLRTLENRFDVTIKLNGDVIPLRVDEEVVSNLFESGSLEAERRISRILSATIGALMHR